MMNYIRSAHTQLAKLSHIVGLQSSLQSFHRPRGKHARQIFQESSPRAHLDITFGLSGRQILLDSHPPGCQCAEHKAMGRVDKPLFAFSSK